MSRQGSTGKSSRKKCNGKTAQGNKCRRWATVSGYCVLHETPETTTRREQQEKNKRKTRKQEKEKTKAQNRARDSASRAGVNTSEGLDFLSLQSRCIKELDDAETSGLRVTWMRVLFDITKAIREEQRLAQELGEGTVFNFTLVQPGTRAGVIYEDDGEGDDGERSQSN